MNRKERIELLPSALLPWYRKNGRNLPWRDDPTPYHVWLSEIMLQQTRIEAAKPYYLRFIREIPDIASLAGANPETLMKLWEGLGYYSRVRNLQTAAQQIMTQYGGVFPEEYEQIAGLKGIGSYTAGAIASICFDKPTPAVDGNVLRVVARITADARPITDEKTKSSVRAELAGIYPETQCGAFTQAIMELGETICIPNGVPDCLACPCGSFCACASGGWENYPVKAPKKERKKEQLTVFCLRCGDYTALNKRDAAGLLAGMWELPNVIGDMTEREALLWAENAGCEPCRVEPLPPKKHIFTHVEWTMRAYRIECRKMPESFVWANGDELKGKFSLPTAFRKILPGY